MNELTLLKYKYPEILHNSYLNCPENWSSAIEKLCNILLAYANRHDVPPMRIHQVDRESETKIILIGNPSPTETKWVSACERVLNKL